MSDVGLSQNYIKNDIVTCKSNSYAYKNQQIFALKGIINFQMEFGELWNDKCMLILKNGQNQILWGDNSHINGGWSGGAMVLGKLPVPGRPTVLITVGQGPIALAVGAGGGGLDIFTLIYPFSSFSLSLGDGSI